MPNVINVISSRNNKALLFILATKKIILIFKSIAKKGALKNPIAAQQKKLFFEAWVILGFGADRTSG